MIKLIDRDGMTVRMIEEQIADSLRVMGNPPGKYLLDRGENTYLESAIEVTRRYVQRFHQVIQFRASTMPHYSWLQVMRKKWRHNRRQKQIEQAFNWNNPHNLIWTATPFVLEMPWLRLKGKKAVTIEVLEKDAKEVVKMSDEMMKDIEKLKYD